ncbi:MAG: hypothetical protein JWQ47_2284 [Glaciihabitans sp.]|nr:hypothetical protein [Glaciihabitans sp.]
MTPKSSPPRKKYKPRNQGTASHPPLRPIAVGIGLGTVVTVGALGLAMALPQASAYSPEDGHVEHSPNEGYRPVRASTTVYQSLRAQVGMVTAKTVEARGGQAILTKLADLRDLDDGWYGPGTVKPSQNLLNWVSVNADAIASNAGDVTVYALADGGVGLHWSQSAMEYTAELRPNNEIYLFADNTLTDEYRSETRPLTAQNLSAVLQRGMQA